MNLAIFDNITWDVTAAHYYEYLIVQLAHVQAESSEFTEAEDTILSEMESVFQRLTAKENFILEWLSADLFMLVGDDRFQQRETTLGTEDSWRKELANALTQEEWEKVLLLLRQESPNFPRNTRIRLRARAYDKLEFFLAASNFYLYAGVITGDSKQFYFSLDSLSRFDLIRAAKLAEEFLRESIDHKIIKILSASILFKAFEVVRGNDREVSESSYYELAKILEPILHDVTTPEIVSADIIQMGYLTYAFCAEQSGDYEVAIRVLDGFIEAYKVDDFDIKQEYRRIVGYAKKELVREQPRLTVPLEAVSRPAFASSIDELDEADLQLALA